MKNQGQFRRNNFMWLDIKGSDMLMNNLGISEYGKKLEKFYEIIDEVCTVFSVRMIDTLGDGVSVTSLDLPVDALVKTFIALQEEVNSNLDISVKAGIHTGDAYMKDIILKSGFRIPLVAGAISKAFRLETFCNSNGTDLIMSADAYAELESDYMRKQFIKSNGQFRRKNSYFPVVYKFASL